MLQSAVVVCPYCAQLVELDVDPSGGRDQVYVQDCDVCCRPWLVSVTVAHGGECQVDVRRSDE